MFPRLGIFFLFNVFWYNLKDDFALIIILFMSTNFIVVDASDFFQFISLTIF